MSVGEILAGYTYYHYVQVSVGEGREELDQVIFQGNGGRQHEV